VHPTASTKQSSLLPVFSVLAAATLWGTSWFPLRILEQNGLQGLWITLIVYAIPAIIGGLVLFRRWDEFAREPMLLTVIGLANAWCNVAFILAVLEGNVMRVLLLFYLYPVWATLLARVLLGEHLTPRAIITLMVAMTGAMVMLWDPSIGFPWPASGAEWLAITSGMAFAVANVTVRKTQTVSIAIKNLATWLGVAGLALAWILLEQTALPAVSQQVWIWTCTLGPLMVLAMTYTVQYGVTKLPVYRSTVILLFELVAGAVSSQLLTDEMMSTAEWLGGALIGLAAYLSARLGVENGANLELQSPYEKDKK
jgi:drug/metabolite transporter (DMT)-like permease